MAARCRKFVPNLFNKTKCQSCFGAKESHSAEALESSKAARKISKCAYLFVSPDLDFSNPLQRTKRWQRRFFILYDDGELTYSVDDNPSTIPQGSVDMNKCNDVFDAEEKTGHEYSIGISVPSKPTSYVKGTSRDEIRRWFDVLVMYPRSLTIKTKRSPGSKAGGIGVARHMSYYPAATEKSVSDDEDADSVHSKDSGDTYERSSRTRGRYKQRDMRRSKSEVRPSDLKLAEDEFNKKQQPGAGSKPTLSLPAVTHNQTSAVSKDRNIDGVQPRRVGEPETFSSVRSMKHRKAAKQHHSAEGSKSSSSATPTPTSTKPQTSSTSLLGGETANLASGLPVNRRLSIPNISSGPKLSEHTPLGRTSSAATVGNSAAAIGGGGANFSTFVYPPATPAATAPAVPLDANETDEHKIAKSEHAKKSMEKSPTVRKGWLLVRQDAQSNVWSKHWFVLSGSSLSYYKDAKAEDTNQIDGVIDVGNAYEVSTIKAERNHGFRIKTKEGEYTLSAMTSGIRRNWIEAVENIIADIRRAKEKSARQDMGFVYESPVRSPRALNAAASAAPAALTPVVPDSSSRINNTLREIAEKRRETGDDRPLEDLYEVVAPHSRTNSTCSDTEREVSSLTSKLDSVTAEAAQPSKSPTAFVSPSQRIKEKSRAKTPPRSRSPPPPTPLYSTGSQPGTSVKNPHHAERSLLLPTGNSSDENDESLNAKLLESQKQVQHLQQQVQDVNSLVRKQRVEIESLQTKLDLTTSQLRDMETALTHSAQNLNKERKNVARLNEALETLKKGHSQSSEYQKKCVVLEKQLQDATLKLSTQDVKMVKELEDQLQIRTSKLATLEKVLNNTRRHLQDAVENSRETELHYQTKMEEIEQEFDEERVELQEKLQQMEDKLSTLITDSSNTINSEVSGQLIKEKTQSVQRLEQLVKEQKGKIDQLTGENAASQQQLEELQCYKDRVAVSQNQLNNANQEYSALHSRLQAAEDTLQSLQTELSTKNTELSVKCQENVSLRQSLEELQDKCQYGEAGQIVSSDVTKQYENEREMLREELESVTAELNAALEASRGEVESLRDSYEAVTTDLQESEEHVLSLQKICKNLEQELKRNQSLVAPASAPGPSSSTPGPSSHLVQGGYTVNQVVDMMGAVCRSTERMVESAVAMLAGEMIETDIKASINFNQDQRTSLGNKTVEQLVKKLSGVRQRLNYIVKNSVSKKSFEHIQKEKESLQQQLSTLEVSAGTGAAPQLEGSANTDMSSKLLTAMLDHCRTEILCLSSDITRLDISHVETKLHSLNKALQNLNQENNAQHFSNDSSLTSYCNSLAIQAAAMFELARSVASGVDLSQVLASVENCFSSASGMVTSIEDLSLRNYALLLAEKLLISYEINHLIDAGEWKEVNKSISNDNLTDKSMVAEALQRINLFTSSHGQPVANSCLNVCLSSILHHRHSERPSLEVLRSETALLHKLCSDVDQSLTTCLREYCSMYTSDLVNFGTLDIGEVDNLLTSTTSLLRKQIKNLVCQGYVSDLSTTWLYEHLCTACNRMRGLDVKDMPSDLLDIVLRLSMLESKFDITSSLVTKRETSTLSQSLVSEACKLAGLSHELARRTASPGSTEARIVSMAHRLEQIDRCLHTFSGHYGDTVQQVMREVVYSLQLSVLKHQFANGQLPMSSAEQSLTHEVEQLKLQLILANQRNKQLVNVEQHEKTVEALHDEMSMLKVEHSAELDESKKDMRMVLKSVKAEEYRLATELTEQISQLKDQLSEQKLNYETEMKKLKECRPDTVSAEDHALLKDKVRDLETCLHEMQEEFEEELYQERRVHLAELDKARSELLKVISKADKAELTTEDQNEQYEAVIRKLKAEQASLQQWIDDIREAHHDEMDALQHERDAALADEVMATQSSLEAMQSAHSIELQQERAKYKEMENKANRLAQVERDLLLQSRENENKDKRIISLENKISSANKKLAKLEMSSANNNNIVDEMKILNHKLAERNKQLVDKFSQEVSKLSSSDKPTSDGQHMTLKSQIEGLKEELRLEQLNKRQLEEHIVSLKADFQHQLLLKEEDVKIESSSSEELLKQRKTTAQTSSSKSSSSAGESPSKPTSSSPSKSGSRTPTGGASSSASRISGKAATRSIPRSIEKTTSSPKKEVDKAYDRRHPMQTQI